MNEKILELARQVAEWHLQDNDECGTIARELYELLSHHEAAKLIRFDLYERNLNRVTKKYDYTYLATADINGMRYTQVVPSEERESLVNAWIKGDFSGAKAVPYTRRGES